LHQSGHARHPLLLLIAFFAFAHPVRWFLLLLGLLPLLLLLLPPLLQLLLLLLQLLVPLRLKGSTQGSSLCGEVPGALEQQILFCLEVVMQTLWCAATGTVQQCRCCQYLTFCISTSRTAQLGTLHGICPAQHGTNRPQISTSPLLYCRGQQ
jgi:hypothetical protein